MKTFTNPISLFIFLISYFIFFSLPAAYSQSQVSKNKIVQIETELGNIKIRLYDETPLHRDNFLKLVEKGLYDSLLFHRVINKFMIQGGDPDSKNAKPGQFLGNGDVDYTVPAEFNPDLFHKKGVLAAARENDIINPKQASSGCQFYIVQGKIYNDSLLQVMEKRMTRYRAYNRVSNKPENQELVNKYKKFSDINQTDSLKVLDAIIDSLTKEEIKKIPQYIIPEKLKTVYKAIGGAPHLDGSYTVFGEVIEGLEVVDKIAVLPTDSNDRPKENVRMKIKLLK